MFLVNSRLGLICATLSDSEDFSPHRTGYPFSRSYGVILPSSLTRVFSHAFGGLPFLPVSVSGTGTRRSHERAFLGVEGSTTSGPTARSPCLECLTMGFATSSSSQVPPVLPLTGWPPSTRHPHCSNNRPVVQDYSPVCHRLRLSASA